MVPIVEKLHVKVSAERAFSIFAESFDVWWPRNFHVGPAEVAEIILEPAVGGRWYERETDGLEYDRGRVLVWEPPRRLVFTWQIDGDWQYDPDPEHASEIDVRFVPDGPGRTAVEFEHHLIHKIVGYEKLYDEISGNDGWAFVLSRYAEAAASVGADANLK